MICIYIYICIYSIYTHVYKASGLSLAKIIHEVQQLVTGASMLSLAQKVACLTMAQNFVDHMDDHQFPYINGHPLGMKWHE